MPGTKSDKNQIKKKPADFSRDFHELEEIVQWFESGEVDLDQGLKKFEQGLLLANRCRDRLAEVENKVIEISEKFGRTTANQPGPAESMPNSFE